MWIGPCGDWYGTDGIGCVGYTIACCIGECTAAFRLDIDGTREAYYHRRFTTDQLLGDSNSLRKGA